jgi:hypothetical protein
MKDSDLLNCFVSSQNIDEGGEMLLQAVNKKKKKCFG